MGTLRGRTVVVTRPPHQAEDLGRLLRAMGAEIVYLPTLEIVAPDDFRAMDEALRNISRYQWVLLTSANGVAALTERLTLLGIDARQLAQCHLAAIGSETAKMLVALGLRVEIVPEVHVAESLVAALRGRVAGQRVLLLRAKGARDVLPNELRDLGARVDVVDCYQTRIPQGSAMALKVMFADAPAPDAITFTSSATARNFFQLLQEARTGQLASTTKLISIGPITTATLRDLTGREVAEAKEATMASLAEAVAAAMN